MDNDLMARRLRPPSEPMQPAPGGQSMSQLAPDEQVDQPLPQWPPMPAPAPEPSLATDTPGSAEPPQVEAPPWAAEAREEVPWDRPDDYEQPTDTAGSDDLAAWDKPIDEEWTDQNPVWPPVVSASAVASTPVETSDPDDAYAPVLGDLAPPMARAWPETNGHYADRDAEAIGGVHNAPVEYATPVETAAMSQPADEWPPSSWPTPPSEPSDPFPPAPEPFVTETPAPDPESTPDADPAPAQWPNATEPAGFAEHQVGPTPPPALFAAAAVATPSETWLAPDEATLAEPEPAPMQSRPADAGAWLTDTAAWPSEPPAPDVAPAVELPEETEPEVAAPAQAAEPVVVRIELAFVDGQLQVVNSANPARDVTPVDVDAEPVMPRHPDFDPHVIGGLGEEAEPEIAPSLPAATPLEPLAASADEPWYEHVEPAAIPLATDSAPWATAQQEVPASTATTPWSQNPPVMDPLAAIPAQPFLAQPQMSGLQPAPPLGPIRPATPLAPIQAAPVFAPPVERDSLAPVAPMEPMAAAAAAATPAVASPITPAAAPEQHDLWFLSTEPDDIDAPFDDDAAAAQKEPSSVLTAVLTIGMAILVIVLVLVFFSLMTSLLR
jgi:hypothetical protein